MTMATLNARQNKQLTQMTERLRRDPIAQDIMRDAYEATRKQYPKLEGKALADKAAYKALPKLRESGFLAPLAVGILLGAIVGALAMLVIDWMKTPKSLDTRKVFRDLNVKEGIFRGIFPYDTEPTHQAILTNKGLIIYGVDEDEGPLTDSEVKGFLIPAAAVASFVDDTHGPAVYKPSYKFEIGVLNYEKGDKGKRRHKTVEIELRDLVANSSELDLWIKFLKSMIRSFDGVFPIDKKNKELLEAIHASHGPKGKEDFLKELEENRISKAMMISDDEEKLPPLTKEAMALMQFQSLRDSVAMGVEKNQEHVEEALFTLWPSCKDEILMAVNKEIRLKKDRFSDDKAVPKLAEIWMAKAGSNGSNSDSSDEEDEEEDNGS